MVYVGFGIVASLSMFTGIALHRPTALRPWRFLALGLALLLSGDVVLDTAGEGPSQFVYLAAHAFLMVGLVLGASTETAA